MWDKQLVKTSHSAGLRQYNKSRHKYRYSGRKGPGAMRREIAVPENNANGGSTRIDITHANVHVVGGVDSVEQYMNDMSWDVKFRTV